MKTLNNALMVYPPCSMAACCCIHPASRMASCGVMLPGSLARRRSDGVLATERSRSLVGEALSDLCRAACAWTWPCEPEDALTLSAEKGLLRVPDPRPPTAPNDGVLETRVSGWPLSSCLQWGWAWWAAML